MIGNQFRDNAGALRATGSGADDDVVVSGNRFIDNSDGVRIDAACAQISGNYISQSFGGLGQGYGVSLAPPGRQCQAVIGNTITEHAVGISHQGIVAVVGNQLIGGDRSICAGGNPCDSLI